MGKVVITTEVPDEAGVGAWAQIELRDVAGDGRLARASLGVARGRASRGTCRRIVDEVLDEAVRAGASRLEISFALGEADLLARLRQRCGTVNSRPAGATCLVDIDLAADAAAGPTALSCSPLSAEADGDRPAAAPRDSRRRA